MAISQVGHLFFYRPGADKSEVREIWVSVGSMRKSVAPRWLLVALAFALVSCSFGKGISEPPASIGRQTLTTLRQVRNFEPHSPGDLVSVHVRAVVTYYDSVAPNLFVQDETGGIWVDLRGMKIAPPRPGQLLDLTGTVGIGFAPYVASPQWRVLGSASMPKVVPLSFEEAASGSFDSQWVEMEGIVRSFVQEAEGSVLVIDVATPRGVFKVRVPDYHAPLPIELVDAKVRFRGVCGSAFNQRKQLVAIHLMVPGLENSTVSAPAPADPFAIAATPVDKIGSFSAQLTDIHRVKVRGVITARFHGRNFFLMDATGGIYVRSQDGTPIAPGDEVEVIGFPARGDYSTVLRSASIRPTRRHQPLVPSKIDGNTALKGGYDARLVTITGTVQAVNQIPESYSLSLRSEDRVNFEVTFGDPAQVNSAPPIGSKVQLTGICSNKTDENGNPSAFEIVLRTPDDIGLLSTPPWLNSQRAAFLLSAFVILTVTVFAWVFMLRRRVRGQTQLIKARLEKEVVLEERYRRIFERNLTGLYVATKDGRILDCNETCALILGYPSRQELLEDSKQAEAITTEFQERLHKESEDGNAQIVNEECRFLCRDGSWRWALVNIRLVNHADAATAVLEGGLIDITDRKAAESQVQSLAYYDSLTGLPNRSLLKDRLATALASAGRHQNKVAILFLDLDRFKIINDSLGHSFGDLLIKEVALRLKKLARQGDTVARVGGDEFLIVLTSVNQAADAAIAAERIVKEMEREFVVHGQTFKVTCSIGISIFPEHGEDDETLIKNADAAMYCAKESGRLAFRFFTDDMNTQVVERLTLENDLRVSVERNELFLVYQPQVCLASGRITGLEALLRWQHPNLGLVPPDRFIPVAESSGLIVPIGEWVLRTACAQLRKWQNAGLEVPSIAVNVSAVQFRQEGFCDLVKTVLRETDLAPRCLELEITESLLMSNGDAISFLLGELKNIGVNLAIDDFGTGYSSLSYLRQFPVGKLKIDGSFIKDVPGSADDSAITAAIIDMGKAMNLKVIAECVETAAQVSFLRARHCDEIQGYYFSKPLAADQAEALLKTPSVGLRAADDIDRLELLLQDVS